ncbi:MAG: uroporphyrinogen decarboxylase [Rhodospirillaceae bacterium]|nr:MAG: uroporphyrinogen decarboxylase [Rhodospirillaceae bacterium]
MSALTKAKVQTPPLIAAARGEATPHTPVWIMRQAGRYLPEYRRVRSKTEFGALTRTPDLAAEVTLQPVRRFNLDAAILFSDIMVPVEGMGVDLTYAPGPVIAHPIRTLKDVAKLRPLVPERDVPYVLETVRMVRAELPPHVALIGFAGSPFTVLSYLVSGKPSKEFATARAFVQSEPEVTAALLDHLADSTAAYLRAQAEAGAQALMLFESWGGLLGRGDFARIALPSVQRLVSKLKDLDVPLIYFANNCWTVLDLIAGLDVQVVGLDWRGSLAQARTVLGKGKTVQGNLDPASLFAPPEVLKRRIDDVLADAGPGGGHIFNLGHGIWPETDPDAVARLVDHVHSRTEGRP